MAGPRRGHTAASSSKPTGVGTSSLPTSPSVASAVDWVLQKQGYILDNGNTLASLANQVWNQWWERRTPLAIDEAMMLVDQTLARPRPQPSGSGNVHSSTAAVYGQLAWVRTRDHIVTGQTDFPWHHTHQAMARYLSTWSERQALRDMDGADWMLLERPGGWAGLIGGNGNHRSFIALASGVPIVRVRLVQISTFTGRPVSIDDPTSTGPIPPPLHRRVHHKLTRGQNWSTSTVETFSELAKRGLCADVPADVFDFLRRTRCNAVAMAWVTNEFPWVIAETLKGVDRRQQILDAWMNG